MNLQVNTAAAIPSPKETIPAARFRSAMVTGSNQIIEEQTPTRKAAPVSTTRIGEL